MLYLALVSLLPTLALASPITRRQADPCVPTSYTISNFQYSSAPSGSTLHFNFQSHFSNPAIITDPASAQASCDASSSSATLPGETVCSTGRNNLYFDVRASQDSDYQLIHTWTCNGHTWMSSTHHVIDPLTCSTDASGRKTCTSETQGFAPENARQICTGDRVEQEEITVVTVTHIEIWILSNVTDLAVYGCTDVMVYDEFYARGAMRAARPKKPAPTKWNWLVDYLVLGFSLSVFCGLIIAFSFLAEQRLWLRRPPLINIEF